MQEILKPSSCPRWSHCSASMCPLEEAREALVVRNEDKVCFLLTESVKRGAAARFRERGLEQIFEYMVGATPEVTRRWGRIRSALERAMKSGSRWDSAPKGGRG